MEYLKIDFDNSNSTADLGWTKKIMIKIISFIFPKANPDYDDKISEVIYWLLEFDNSTSLPNREIGIDKNEKVIVKMPFKKNYGYWTDNNLKYNDFKKIFKSENITQNYFNEKWNLL